MHVLFVCRMSQDYYLAFLGQGLAFFDEDRLATPLYMVVTQQSPLVQQLD